ncbi:MAG: hypothetical protein ACKVQC_05095, partial [Elusimicrobiota bacterium]
RQVLVASFTLKGRRYLLLGSANGAVDLVSSQQGDVNTRSILYSNLLTRTLSRLFGGRFGLALIGILIFSGVAKGAELSGGSSGNEFLSTLIDFTAVEISDQIFARSIVFAMLCAFLIGYIYAKFHHSKRYEEEFRETLLIISLAVVSMITAMQVNLLVGLAGMVGALSMFRFRIGMRSGKDMAIQMAMVGITFWIGIKPDDFMKPVIMTLALCILMIIANKMHINRGNIKDYTLSVVMKPYDQRKVALIYRLLDLYALTYTKGDAKISTKEFSQTFQVTLKNKGDGGMEEFRNILLAIGQVAPIEGSSLVINPRKNTLDGSGGTLFSFAVPSVILMAIAGQDGVPLFASLGSLEMGILSLVLLIFVLVLVLKPQRKKINDNAVVNGLDLTSFSEEDRARINQLLTPPQISAKTSIGNFSRRVFWHALFIIAAIAVAIHFRLTKSSVSSPKIFYGKVEPLSEAPVYSATTGKLVAVYVKKNMVVNKDDVLALVAPLTQEEFGLESKKIEADIQLKKSQVLADLEKFNLDIFRSNQAQMQNTINFIQNRFQVRVQKIELEANTVKLLYAQAQLRRLKLAFEQSSASASDVAVVEELVEELKKRISEGTSAIFSTEQKMLNQEKMMEQFLRSIPVHETTVKNRFENLLKDTENSGKTELALLEYRYRPKTIVAPISGKITLPISGVVVPGEGIMPEVGVEITDPKKEIWHIYAEGNPNKITGYIAQGASLPKKNEVWYVLLKDKSQVPVRVVDVSNFMASVPESVQAFQKSMEGPFSVRGGIRTVNTTFQGVPVELEIIDDHKFTIGESVQIIPGSKGETVNQPKPATTKKASLGRLDGIEVTLLSQGRMKLGGVEFAQISGSVVVEKAGDKLLLVANDSGKIALNKIGVDGAIQHDKTVSLKNLNDDPDIEALALDGKDIVILMERSKEIHIIPSALNENPQRVNSVVIPILPVIQNPEGLDVHPISGNYFISSVKNKAIYEVSIDKEKKGMKIVRVYNLSASALAPIRDIKFYRSTDGSLKLAILESGNRPKIRFLNIQGSNAGKLEKDFIDLSDLGLAKAEALEFLPDRKIFVGSETKGFGPNINDHVILEVGQNSVKEAVDGKKQSLNGGINTRRGFLKDLFPNGTFASWIGFSFFTLSLVDETFIPLSFVFSGVFLLGMGVMIIAYVKNSLNRALGFLQTPAAVILTVTDETFDTDFSRAKEIIGKIQGNQSLQNNLTGVIISYIGNQPDRLAQLKLAAPDALFVEGLRPNDRGIYDLSDILRMAQVQLMDLSSKTELKRVIDQLVNPLSKDGNFVFVSSKPELFDIPANLQERVWMLSMIMGIAWTIDPYQSVVGQIESVRSSLIAA